MVKLRAYSIVETLISMVLLGIIMFILLEVVSQSTNIISTTTILKAESEINKYLIKQANKAPVSEEFNLENIGLLKSNVENIYRSNKPYSIQTISITSPFGKILFQKKMVFLLEN